jgi:hypothetical protein
MRTIFYDQRAICHALSDMPLATRMGSFCGVIRVNGKPVLGSGHTVTEAERNTLQAAKVKWPHHSHIFDLIGRKPMVSA